MEDKITLGNCKVMIGDNVIGYCIDVKLGEIPLKIEPIYEIKPCEYTTEGTIEFTRWSNWDGIIHRISKEKENV